MKKNYSPLSQLRYDIVEIAKDLQKEFGVTHQERRYHSTFFDNLQSAAFRVENKPKLVVKGKSGKQLFHYEPDLYVRRDGLSLLVELKADDGGLSPAHIQQAKSYLSVAPKQDKGIFLMNFARKSKSISYLPEFKMIHRSDL